VYVRVRLFAGLRERAGTGALEVELPDGALLGDVWPALGLGEEPSGLLFAVNRVIGTTRARSRGRDVVYLEYEAYEGMAEDMMAQLAAELARCHELCAVAIHHRVGRVEIGEVSVVIAVSAPHRAAALEACREAIDELKVSVPLWKKEVYAGGEEWIGKGS